MCFAGQVECSLQSGFVKGMRVEVANTFDFTGAQFPVADVVCVLLGRWSAACRVALSKG